MKLFPQTPKGFFYLLISFLIIAGSIYIVSFFIPEDVVAPVVSIQTTENENKLMSNTNESSNEQEAEPMNTNQVQAPQPELNEAAQIPLKNSDERITKKPFGIYITPESSPVSPEKFSGYHTGTDFEIFSGEEQADVEIRAICDGDVVAKRRVSGYGGVLIQRCFLVEQEVTVLYGHLALSSIASEVGSSLTRGQNIGLLGANKSNDTDGERKHLHLGIHKGTAIEYRGYVQNENELSEWIDFESLNF